jgi:hypothetical protein
VGVTADLSARICGCARRPARNLTFSRYWFPQRRSDQFSGAGLLRESDYTKITHRDSSLHFQLHIFGETPAVLVELSNFRNLLHNGDVRQMPAAVLPA